MKIIVTGTNMWSNTNIVKSTIDKYASTTDNLTLIHGYGGGVDSIVSVYAKKMGYEEIGVRLDPSVPSVSASLMKVEDMMKLNPDKVIIFDPDIERSNYARLVRSKARKYGIPYEVYNDTGVYEKRDFKSTLIITHTDLDGIACEILLKKIYPDSDSIRVDYSSSTEESLLQSMQYYDTVILGDFSYPKEIFDKCIRSYIANGLNFYVYDHHQTVIDEFGDELHTLPWVVDTTRCGAKIIYDEFVTKYSNELRPYHSFIELVNDYDLWIHDYEDSIKLQLTFDGYSDKDEFRDRWIASSDMTPTPKDELCYRVGYEGLINSVSHILSTLKTHTDKEGLVFGLCTYKRNFSLSAHTILNSGDTTIDYLVGYHNYYKSSLSFRTPSSNPVNVRKIAESLGGGGHDESAGATIIPGMDILESVKQRKIVLK